MTKEGFLHIASDRYDSLQALNKLDDFYDYEKEFIEIWRDMGRQVLEKNIGVPNANTLFLKTNTFTEAKKIATNTFL